MGVNYYTMEKNKVINGFREGYWEESWFSGKLYAKGHYINGERVGYWEFYDYFINGQLLFKEYIL